MRENKISAIIVDDESDAREVLSNLLSKYPNIDIISKNSNVSEAFASINENHPDIVFLDIELSETESGFDLLSMLKQEHKPTIIFVTSYNEYAIKAFEFAAFDYLLKPIDPDRLDQCIERYKSEKQSKDLQKQIADIFCCLNKNKIKINTRTGFILIDPDEIVHCESNGNCSNIIFNNGKKVPVSIHLKGLEKLLPSNNFIRLCKSNIINIDYLIKVDRKRKLCYLKNSGKEIELKIPGGKLKSLERRWMSD
ncbi:MAG: response regulator [Bacteroidales bacterium]|nr:response regulator [Bacteroidales bacterium]